MTKQQRTGHSEKERDKVRNNKPKRERTGHNQKERNKLRKNKTKS